MRSGSDVVVSLGRMRAIRAVDQATSTMTVEAGVTLAAVQQAAMDAGLHFPLSLASEGSCTIGGNLSTNAGGTAVLRYGNARDLVLGLEVVLADGRVWDGLRGCARTTPATISSSCSSAAKGRSASSPPRC
jgi:FAD/FMN-containing dehydrogenase